MTNRNTRLIDDMGTLARSLDNRAAGYRLAGESRLAGKASVAARALRDATDWLQILADAERTESSHD